MALIEKRKVRKGVNLLNVKATKTIAILPTGNLCEADTTYIFMLLVWLVPRIATYLFFGYSGLVFLGIVLRTLFIKKYYSSEIQEK